MEFDLGRKNRTGLILNTEGNAAPAHPQHLALTDDGLYLRLAEGPELSFITQYTGGVQELVIDVNFFPNGEYEFDGEDPDAEGGGDTGFPLSGSGENETTPARPAVTLNIPCAPLATSQVRENGSAVVISDEGISYAFTRQAGGSGMLSSVLLTPENHGISYRAIPERRSVNPDDYILASAKYTAEYDAALSLWLDKSYSGWNRASLSNDAGRLFSNDGATVNAYLSEAIKRGTYRSAAQAVMAVYAPAAGSTSPWEASVYAGKLDVALRFLSTAERERYARLARIFNEKSADFLREYRVISYLGVRGYGNFLDDAADMLRGFDPSVISIEQSPGFLEGRNDWETLRSDRDNPFERFTDQACFVVNDGLRQNSSGNMVLVFTGNEADAEFNLRLGAGLARFEDETRRALGKSLILSVLAFADEIGSVPRTVTRNSGGDFAEKPDGGRLSSARIYRICAAGGGDENYYGRAVALNTSVSREAMWAWTAARISVASESESELNIAVNFPAGETHYLLLRGVRPFARIQLHGVDFPANPQFERSDASGWNYSAPEQTLLIKMRHRSATEYIRILQTAAPAQSPPPETEAETDFDMF
jgi:hypothetical protein